MGCTVGRPPGGLTAGRGRGVLGLGGLRACEGVRGRARACEGVFYPDPIIDTNSQFANANFDFVLDIY